MEKKEEITSTLTSWKERVYEVVFSSVIKQEGSFTDFLITLGVVACFYVYFLQKIVFPTADCQWFFICGMDDIKQTFFRISITAIGLFFLVWLANLVRMPFKRGAKAQYKKGSVIIKSTSDEKGVGKSEKLPVHIESLEQVQCRISIENSEENLYYWRAGILFRSLDESSNYTFHMYRDNENDNLIHWRSVYILKGTKIEDKRDEIIVEDLNNFSLNIMYKSDKLKISLDEKLSHEIAVDDSVLRKLSLEAWADGRPYQVRFTDVAVKGKLLL